MKVLVVADGHYYMDSDDKIYVDSVFDYNFYARYLTAFEDVYAIVRAERVSEIPKGSKIASGKGVHFLLVPPSVGLVEHLKVMRKTHKLIEQYIQDFDKAIIRVPGVIANQVYNQYSKHKEKKLALEVVVDPWEYFAPGTVNYKTRPIFRYWWTKQLKKMCLRADGVSYVTEEYLQKKYPCKAIIDGTGFTSSYSSVELPDEDFKQPKIYKKKDKYVISHVASNFATMGKGHVPLMKAIKVVREKGFDVNVEFIGDGPLRSYFMRYAEDLGITENVDFVGLLTSGNAVRERIGASDLFVFPTRAEGLPRVVLEAMAEGLPVISTPTCGIPEIIPSDYLVPYEDYKLLASTIIKFLESPKLMNEASIRNLEVSKKYSKSELMKKRKDFYNQLRML